MCKTFRFGLVSALAVVLSLSALALVMRAPDQPGMVWKYRSDQGVFGQPAIDGDDVYFGLEGGVLYRMNSKTREVKWTFDGGRSSRGKPIVQGNKVLIAGGGRIHILRKRSGQKVWDMRYRGSGLRNNLAMFGKLVFILDTESRLTALDFHSGTVKWKSNIKIERTRAGIVAEKGSVFVECEKGDVCSVDVKTGRLRWKYPCARRGTDRMFVAEGVLYLARAFMVIAVDARTGKEIWNRKIRLGYDSIGHYAGQLYYLDHPSTLYAFDAKDGSEKWVYEIPDCHDASAFHPPVFYKGRLYLQVHEMPHGRDRGLSHKLLVIDLERRRLEHSIPMSPGFNVPTALTLSGGSLYYGSREGLHVIDARTGNSSLLFRTGGKLASSPAAFGKTILVGSHSGKLHALDAGTGKPVWRTNLGDSPVRTPVVAGDRVLVSTRGGLLMSLNGSDGKERWRREISSVPRRPVTSGDLVLIGDRTENLRAFDLKTGKPRWSFTGEGPLGPPRVHAGRCYVSCKGGKIYSLDLKTGKKVRTFQAGRGVRTMALSDRILYVREIDGKIKALRIDDGREVWSIEMVKDPGSAMLVHQNTLLVGVGKYLVALDTEDGDKRWWFLAEADDKSLNHPIEVVAQPLVHDGVVYVGGDDHTLYAVDLESGKKLWRFEVGGPVRSTPVVVGDHLFFTSEDGVLYAVDIKPGKYKWQFSPAGEVTFEPVVFSDFILIGTSGGVLYALDKQTGEERWRLAKAGKIPNAPQLFKGVLFFGNESGEVIAADLKSGDERWRAKTRTKAVGKTLIVGDTLYVDSSHLAERGFMRGCRYSYLHALDVRTGRERWTFGAVDQIVGELLSYSGGLVFSTCNGLIMSVDRHSGKQRWRINTRRRYTFYRTPPFDDGRGFFMSRRESQSVLRAIELADGEMLWEREEEGKIRSVQKGCLVVSQGSERKCFGVKDGKELKCPPKPPRIKWRTVAGEGVAYTECKEGYLCAVDTKTEKEKWKIMMKGSLKYSPLLHDNLLYITTRTGHVCAVDLQKIIE